MTKPGKAADGIAKTEVDYHRKRPAAGSICAVFVKYPSMFKTRATQSPQGLRHQRTPRKNGSRKMTPKAAFEYEVLE
jgi:hypothetical protein